MQYTFQLMTTQGLITDTIVSDLDFSDGPFLIKGFRSESSTTCDLEIINEFWNSVETILQNNNLTTDNFIEVVRAYKDTELLGECDNYQRIIGE